MMRFPFDDMPNTAAITCCHILDEHMPIRFVSHDEDDGMWQFLCGKTHGERDARMISLRSVCALDHSVAQVAKMPCGCIAERKKIGSNWMIRKG